MVVEVCLQELCRYCINKHQYQNFRVTLWNEANGSFSQDAVEAVSLVYIKPGLPTNDKEPFQRGRGMGLTQTRELQLHSKVSSLWLLHTFGKDLTLDVLPNTTLPIYPDLATSTSEDLGGQPPTLGLFDPQGWWLGVNVVRSIVPIWVSASSLFTKT